MRQPDTAEIPGHNLDRSLGSPKATERVSPPPQNMTPQSHRTKTSDIFHKQAEEKPENDMVTAPTVAPGTMNLKTNEYCGIRGTEL